MDSTDKRASRRAFLSRTALMSLGAAAAGTGAAPVAAQTTPAATQDAPPRMPPHGAEPRGQRLVARNRKARGRFGFMFPDLPAFEPDETLLTGLGQRMEETPVVGTLDASGKEVTSNDNDLANDNLNKQFTSGFTFFGQFLDHDITFDDTPLNLQIADPDAVKNFRTPRYDLDSVYGRGPGPDRHLYDPDDQDKLLIVKNANGVYDLPRLADGTAIIADPRNDQHLIIAQLHLAFMKFHNALVDYVRTQRVPKGRQFEIARELCRWHFQWIVIHQFLPLVVGEATRNAVYQERASGAPVITLNYYEVKNRGNRPFIPVEFSVAAYRFGHSITRPRYTISGSVSKVPLFEAVPSDNNLNASRPLPARLEIEWARLFGPEPTARPVRRIDASLAAPLFALPSNVVPDGSSTLLAVRNLLRGKMLGLPSGQEVARAMGIPALTNKEDLGLTGDGWAKESEAPLWYYILKEAEMTSLSMHLGPVGGRIVAEVLVGLLLQDRNSYLSSRPDWKPEPPIAPKGVGDFTMVDLLKFAGYRYPALGDEWT